MTAPAADACPVTTVVQAPMAKHGLHPAAPSPEGHDQHRRPQLTGSAAASCCGAALQTVTSWHLARPAPPTTGVTTRRSAEKNRKKEDTPCPTHA